MNKLLVIVGPTSSGKSELTVKLAKKFRGEIISCDSRQIYKGMDLGTGKIRGKWSVGPRAKNQQFLYKGIVHYCIDFVNPKKQYSVSLFQRDAKKSIANVVRRGKLPILCGGTAHWIDAVVYDQVIPDVKPNAKLRARLEKKPAADLFRQLQKLDSRRAKSIDRFNKRRLIRALEIVISTGKPVPPLITHNSQLITPTTLWLGINPPRPVLFANIKKRLSQRLKSGMIKEVARLRRQGLSWKRLESFGLEYKFASLYLQKKLNYDEMFDQLFIAITQFSKRQMTWWKKNKEIHWFKKPSGAQKLADQNLQIPIGDIY